MSEAYLEPFLQTGTACVHFLSSREIEALTPQLEAAGLVVMHVALEGALGKGTLLAAVARATGCPHDQQPNWDGLRDILGDLEWQPGAGYLLCVPRARELWATQYELAGQFLELCLDAADWWRGQDTPFHLVFLADATS